jgi:general secretion pathway protein A
MLFCVQVQTFIQHRLKLVGGAPPELFTPEALALIARYAQGIPRLINLLCENALELACEQAHAQVGAELIEAVARTFRLEANAARGPGSEPGTSSANGASARVPLAFLLLWCTGRLVMDSNVRLQLYTRLHELRKRHP